MTNKELRVGTEYIVREHKTYFETSEQAKAFIEMYETEIKELMNIN